MSDFKKNFEDFKGHIWLNAASEGPLPRKAAQDLLEVIQWKSLPHKLGFDKFIAVPKRLKEAIAQLICENSRDIILGNSASYGLHLLANGIAWRRGDEVLLMQNDFPTNILPWLALEKKGVRVIQIKPKGSVLTPEELERNISRKARLFCISHVHTFSGYVMDIQNFSRICEKDKVLFVVNISQSVGTMPLDFSHLKVDAIVAAGYKWLCGPYGVGFCWIEPSLRKRLDINLAYWVARLSEEELHREDILRHKEITTARKFDMFGTANFFNFVPFNSAIRYFSGIGLDKVFKHNQSLIDRFIDGLPESYDLISSRKGKDRSNLVLFSHKDKERNRYIYRELIDQKVYPGFWKGNIRIAPHVYNTQEDIDRTLKLLERLQ